MRTLSLQPSRLTTRASDNDSLTIEGIAVPWGNPIVYGGVREEFQRGAISADDAVGRPLLWSHDRNEPVGHITEARDTEEGLSITAVVQPTTRGRDAIALISGGSLRGMSVGFQPDETRNTSTGVVFTRASLVELSLTPLPAYESAAITNTREEEAPDMSETTEVREAPQVDLAPISERIDQLEARMLERQDRQPARRLGVVEGFVEQLRGSQDARHIRALADVLSSGNAGLLPPTWSSEVRGYTDAMRYFIPRAGSMAFPSVGHTLTVPKRTQSTTVAARGAEKSEIPSRAYTSGSDTYTADWYAGGVDIALEVIWQSDPAILTLVVQDILEQYAVVTDQAVTLAAETAATPTGAALDTSSYGALVADLIEAGETIRAATGQFGDLVSLTTASWQAVLGLVDADGRRVLANIGATNADGSAGLTAGAVNIGGINLFHNPRAAEDLVFNQKSFRVAEKPPVTLQSDNVALMGRDLGVLGALIELPLYPAGLLVFSAL